MKTNDVLIGKQPEKHLQFPNPMRMTEFEKSLVARERIERAQAKNKYIEGLQGVDGGEIA